MKYYYLPRLIVASQLALGEGSRARHSTCAWASRGGGRRTRWFGVGIVAVSHDQLLKVLLCIYTYGLGSMVVFAGLW